MYTLTVAAGPTITVLPASLSDFTYVAGTGPSAEQSFAVSGSLLSTDMTVISPENYEISLGTGGSFVSVNPIVLAQSGGNVSGTTIYARLKGNLFISTYSEGISLVSTGAASKSVTCNGSVTCVPSTISFANSEVQKMMGDPDFILKANLPYGTNADYSSSNLSVATVNATTAEVTIKGLGTATILATQPAMAGYCAATASYTLNVAIPTILVTPVLIPDMTAEVGSTDYETITVNGTNLIADITLALDNASIFAISLENLAQTGGVVLDKLVTITYSPMSIGTHTATLTLSSTGAADVIRVLSGVANNGPVTGFYQLSGDLKVSVIDGNLLIPAVDGDRIEVYNAIGQKLISKLAIDGLNAITISAHGLVLVKVGTRVAKVIL
jgi:hypothetical protein